MAKRRVALTHRKQRSVLTDMLPFEVPPTFSNHGFYSFLKRNGIEFEDGRLRWIARTPDLDKAICLLFGIKASTDVKSDAVTEWGKKKTRNSVPINACRMDTNPFNFRVAHKLDGRTLSVVHPRNQVEVASFYANHSSLIIYYTSMSEFSIRRPVSVSRYVFFKDKMHEQVLDRKADGIEEDGREYEQLGSYFVYKKYRNIHRFFESYKYHRCEKKYNAMVQIDVSKCFDSIYTHSLPWAVLGKAQVKFDLEESKGTFAGRFDALMQGMNHKETNGIVIGPEFSRIFAEVILQSVDAELLDRLNRAQIFHKTDYEIFRYVDDFFVFYNDPSTQLKIFEVLQDTLKSKKLSINTAKIRHYQKPIITEITVAKERISSLLNLEIDPNIEEDISKTEDIEPSKTLKCQINSNRLIVKYKTAIKESDVEYGDLLNYTFAIVENKIDKLLATYLKCSHSDRNERRLLYSLLAIMEFAFFAYSASPKVNHTIRICRMISTSIDFLQLNKTPYELKHLLFKYVHDNILQQFEKKTMNVHREVEDLYLLISLSQTGKEYWIPESSLARHFLISENKQTSEFERPDLDFMNHFSITALLTYMKKKVRYKKLRSFIETHAISKLDYMKVHCPHDAESLMLLLDLVVCPYVRDTVKESAAAVFGLDKNGLTSLQSVNDRWFTAWGDEFNIGKELDAKRSREVY
jgi:hypothetical protein